MNLSPTFCHVLSNIERTQDRKLTPSEQKVALLMLEGFERSVIAQRLYLGVATIATHSREVYAKCGVQSQSGLIAKALDFARSKLTLGPDADSLEMVKFIAPYQRLSPAESRTAIALLKGLGRDEIAEQVKCSPRTIATHAAKVYAKCDVASQPELIAKALKYVIENSLLEVAG